MEDLASEQARQRVGAQPRTDFGQNYLIPLRSELKVEKELTPQNQAIEVVHNDEKETIDAEQEIYPSSEEDEEEWVREVLMPEIRTIDTDAVKTQVQIFDSQDDVSEELVVDTYDSNLTQMSQELLEKLRNGKVSGLQPDQADYLISMLDE